MMKVLRVEMTEYQGFQDVIAWVLCEADFKMKNWAHYREILDV
jgi:hypothetical protein